MRLLIGKQELARVMANVGRVVESRNTIPILGNVMLAAAGGGLAVTGTDLDIVAAASANADIEQDGAVCVDAKLFGDIVKKVGGDISISLEAEKLIVKSGRSRFSLATLPASDFPDLGGGTFTAEFEIDLASLFAPVSFAISSDDVRYYLQGIFLHSHEGKLSAVATDGHRLAAQSIVSVVTIPDIIVPKKTVGLLPKGSVKVSVSDTKIRIVSDGLVITSKLIEGTFPDYRRVIPSANDKVVTFDRDALLSASDRVATISSERGRAVKFSIAPGSISLSVRSDVGDAADEIAADYAGEPVDIGFNAGYVRDMLSVLPTGEVSFALADGGSPALVKSAAVENWTGVCMPMRV
ncbi:DNA polymerase III subunit beta [Sinorhizobium medicae]|nr:DNA polymerase III subunit beta [Sinorhizobium medicae]